MASGIGLSLRGSLSKQEKVFTPGVNETCEQRLQLCLSKVRGRVGKDPLPPPQQGCMPANVGQNTASKKSPFIPRAKCPVFRRGGA